MGVKVGVRVLVKALVKVGWRDGLWGWKWGLSGKEVRDEAHRPRPRHAPRAQQVHQRQLPKVSASNVPSAGSSVKPPTVAAPPSAAALTRGKKGT